MDPRLHQGRREAKVEALERTYAHKNTTYYVDAANYDHANNKTVATVVDHTLAEPNDEQNGHPVTSRRAEQTTELQVLKPRSPAPCTSRTPNYWDNAAEHEWVDEHATLPEPEPLMGSGENSSESSHDGTDTEQAASSSPETSSVETSRDSWVVLLSEGEEQKVLDHENGEELAELLVAEAHFPPLDVGNASPRDTGITPRVGATMPSHLTRCSW
ncbi:hypothetical protein MRX96_016052 [Rhipicephalus microplus]